MMRIIKNAVLSAAAMALCVATSSAFAGDVIVVDVLSANQAQHVNLGSKTALGYYGKSNGKCDLTVMVGEIPHAEATASDTTAARLRVSVTPGTAATVESTEGRSVEFFCGPQARRMMVKSLRPDTTPRS